MTTDTTALRTALDYAAEHRREDSHDNVILTDAAWNGLVDAIEPVLAVTQPSPCTCPHLPDGRRDCADGGTCPVHGATQTSPEPLDVVEA